MSRVSRALFNFQTDSYALLVSIASALGFGMGVADVTFFDAHFSNPVYGIRSYPLGYYALVFCFPEFYITLRLVSSAHSLPELDLPTTRAVYAFAIPMIVTLVISPNFLTVGASVQPEFPHRGLMEVSFVAGLFCGAGTYLHNLRRALDFSFVKKRTISVDARIQMLKLMYSTWSDALKLLVGLYVGIAGVYLIYSWNISIQVSGGNVTEAFFRTAYGQLFTLFYSVFLVVGVVSQLFRGMDEIKNQFLRIHN